MNELNYELQYELLKDEAENHPDMMYYVLLGCLNACILQRGNLDAAKKYLLAYEQLKKEGKLKRISLEF
jgi:hypothetical protein